MPHLILVKHSLPELQPDRPASGWRLSEEGRRRCAPLVEALTVYKPEVIVASAEPKATETARLVAERMALPYRVVDGLHEHDRSNVGWLGTAQLEASVARFFAEPQALVLGLETAEQAQRRFVGAVGGVLESNPDRNVVIVAHGTVITLFVAQMAAAATPGFSAFAFWKELGLPSFVVLVTPSYELRAVVDRIENFP